MMTGDRFTFTWQVEEAGWALCTVDEVSMAVSYLFDAPPELITAVCRLLEGADEQRVQLSDEPSAHRWWFTRDGDDVRMRIVRVRNMDLPDTTGEEVWWSVQPLAVVARAVIRAFDHVAWQFDDQTYLARWRRPFPRQELDVLRAMYRRSKQSDQ